MATGFGNWVRANREQLGLEQWELADRMGYANRTSISKIENTQSKRPSAAVVLKFAEVFGKTMDQALDETGLRGVYSRELPKQGEMTPGSQRVAAVIRTRYRRLTDEQADLTLRLLGAAVVETPPGQEETSPPPGDGHTPE